jgi:two-component system response regulator RpfG
MGAVIALGHHEKYDGNGYPGGLSGENIPLPARIVAVADVYDALSSRRCYKPAWAHRDVMQLLHNESGRHFDPRCIDAFMRRLDEVRKIQDMLRDDRNSNAEPAASKVRAPEETLV